MSDTTPSAPVAVTPGQTELSAVGGVLEVPADHAGEETKPKRGAGRPTTRAGRREAAAAKAAAKSTPSASSSSPAKADKAPARPRTTQAEVKNSIETLHGMIGGTLPLVGMPRTGALLEESGKDAGEVWADLVKRYPKLERLFGASTDGLIYYRLFLVYAPIFQTAAMERSSARPPSTEDLADLGVVPFPQDRPAGPAS